MVGGVRWKPAGRDRVVWDRNLSAATTRRLIGLFYILYHRVGLYFTRNENSFDNSIYFFGNKKYSADKAGFICDIWLVKRFCLHQFSDRLRR